MKYIVGSIYYFFDKLTEVRCQGTAPAN